MTRQNNFCEFCRMNNSQKSGKVVRIVGYFWPRFRKLSQTSLPKKVLRLILSFGISITEYVKCLYLVGSRNLGRTPNSWQHERVFEAAWFDPTVIDEVQKIWFNNQQCSFCVGAHRNSALILIYFQLIFKAYKYYAPESTRTSFYVVYCWLSFF